jgi:hypothetical protein
MSLGQRINLASTDKGAKSTCVERETTESVVGRHLAGPACHGESWPALTRTCWTAMDRAPRMKGAH